MSNYSKADTRTQWFEDNYPGGRLNLTPRTAVVVLHTTEGANWPGYEGGATAPNYTHLPSLTGKAGVWRAHFPDERSSRALRNLAGGVETNTLNAIQVELIGTCDSAKRVSWAGVGRAGKDYVYWPEATEAQLKEVAALLADLHRRHGLQLVAPKPFLRYPDSYGNSRVRMSFAEWRSAVGVVGHQHVPENSHGDPGDLKIDKILELARQMVKPAAEPTKPPKPKGETHRLDLAHFSLQFSDTPAQQKADVAKIFTRGYEWVTGTEAGQEPLKGMLAAAAEDAGYKFHAYKSNWIAVRRTSIQKGTYKTGGDTIIENDLVAGRGHDTNIVWVRFEHPELGEITVLCSHYPTMGRPEGPPEKRVNLWANQKLAAAIGDKAREAGKGSALVFYGGDQNINDAIHDTFFGQPLTSAQDELGKHERTHWAQIDVIASYDRDGRVEAKYVRALDDSELTMHTDHHPVEAGFLVRKRSRA